MPDATESTTPRLSRGLVGVTVAAAEARLSALELDFTNQRTELERQIAEEQAHQQRLAAEIDRLKEQLQTARGTVEVLRSKLASERAARAVLVARVLDQQARDLEEARADAVKQARYESIRIGAQMEREQEALQELVESLYRMVVAHGGLPPGLQVRAELQPPPPAPAGTGETPQATPKRDRWHKFLSGKIIGKTLLRKGGKVLIYEGAMITPQVITAAEADGLLFDLILAMRLPLPISEL